MLRKFLAVPVLFALVNCADQAVPPTADTKQSAAKAEQDYTHVVPVETPYYNDGPEQGRRHDGMFTEGTKVNIVRKAGSVILVRSEDGITAWLIDLDVKMIEETTDIHDSGLTD